MLDVNDKWSELIYNLMYVNDGLNKKEQIYINKTLKKKALYHFINLRYPSDSKRYDKMTKKELISELIYPRYN